MKIRIVDEKDIEPTLDQAIRDLLVVCFPHVREIYAVARRWRGNVPLYSVLLEDSDALCGHVAVVDRTIRVGSEPLRVAAIGNVAVKPACRGRRLVDGVLAAAMEEAGRRGFDCGFLFTHPPTDRIYARNGWIEVAAQTIRVENNEEIEIPPENVRMYYPLRIKDFPVGPIHLQGDKW